MRSGIILASVLSLVAFGLFSPPVEQIPPGGEIVDVKYLETTVLEFKGANLEGDVETPSASYGVVKGSAKFDLTIKVRTSFLPEVMKTASFL